MNPNEISLENMNKMFEFEKISRDIDSISDINQIKTLAKCYVKLYLKQQEIVSKF